MLKRTLILPAALCALASLPSLAASAGSAKPVLQPSASARSTTISPGEDGGFDLSCRGAGVALSGALRTSGDAPFVRGTIPASNRAGSWEYVLDGAGGSAGGRVRAELRCLSLALPNGVGSSSLRVNTNRSAVLSLAAGADRAVGVRCNRGYLPTGYGLVGEGGARLAAAVPGRRGWSFRLENTGARPARAAVRVRCLQRKASGVRAGAPTTLTFEVRRAAFADQVAAGASVLRHACRAGEFSLATGVKLDPADDLVMTSSSPVGARGGEWRFSQASGSARVDTYLLCLTRDSRFR